jgi:hypothetical protein
LQGFEQGPVLNVVPVLSAVVDSRKAVVKSNPKLELCQNSWSRLLQDRSVELTESKLLQMDCEQLAQTADPFAAANIGVISRRGKLLASADAKMTPHCGCCFPTSLGLYWQCSAIAR